MYKIYIDNWLLHDDRLEDYKVITPRLNLELNKTGALEFTITHNHINYNRVSKLKGVIAVYQDNDIIFRGRIISEEIGLHNEKKVFCEGDLAYLIDTIQRPDNFTGTVAQFFSRLIDKHNAQTAQRFTVGRVTVTGNASASDEYATTLSEVERLIAERGGYIKTRYEGGITYIDYLAEISTITPQRIEFGGNLLDIKKLRKSEDIATAVIPLGAKVDNERVNIKAVNGGLDYIQDTEGVAAFGFICKTLIFDNITDATELLRLARIELPLLVSGWESIELSAVDLSQIDAGVTPYRLGNKVRVISAPHNLDELFLIDKLELNLLDPAGDKITLGNTARGFTEDVTFTKGDKGDKGADGKGVANITEEFYLSTSKTSQAGGTWSTNAPSWIYGRYLWTRLKSVYSDGTISYTVPAVSTEWEAVNYLEIGGRNLFENSAKITEANIGIYQGAYDIQVETEQFINGCNIISAKYLAEVTTGGIYLRGTPANYIPKMIIDETYTVSVWAKCSINIERGFINAEFLRDVIMTAPNLSTEWQLYTITGIYNGNITEQIAITFYYGTNIPIGETIYITSPKVEHGNKATDWTPAPEDIATEIATPIYNLEQNFESAIEQAENEITLRVAENYYLKDETDSLVSSVSTELTNTKNSVDIQFNTFNADIEALQNGTEAEFELIRKYIRFIDGKILLGEEGNALELEIRNDRISFLQSGAEVAYFSNNQMYVTDAEFTHSLKIGNFAFIPRDNENLSFKKITATSSNSIVGLAIVGDGITE